MHFQTARIVHFGTASDKFGGERFIEQALEVAFGEVKSDKKPGEILLTIHVIAEIMAKIKRKSMIKMCDFVLVE